MKIDQLRQVVEIHKTGSINRASQNLFLTQSSISSSIKALEQELGREIFARTPRGVQVTEFGASFIEHSKEILKHVEQILMEASEDHNTKRQPYIAIAVHYLMFASYPLSHLLHKYKDQGFGINYFEKNRSDITSLLVSKEVEIGLMTMFSIDKENWLSAFKSQGIEYSPLILQGPFIAVGPPSEFYDDQWTCVTPEVLANHKMMVFSETREPFSSIERKLVKVFNPSGSLTVSDRGSQLSLLHQTDSYLVCAYNANAYRTATFYKDIKCLPITGTDISCEIGYVKLRDRSLSAVAQEYLQMITDMLK